VVFVSLGELARGEETLDEVLAGVSGLDQLGFAAAEFHHLTWAGLQLGREAEIAAVLERQTAKLPWIDVARAVLARDFRAAADQLAAMESPTQEAFYRLRAAEALVAEGRRAEADEQLRAALAFYRAVGATRYMREGEALLAATA
jgi:hypothetical protein